MRRVSGRGQANEDIRRGPETENGDSLVTQVDIVFPPCRVELDTLVVVDPWNVRERGTAQWAERSNQDLRLNVLRSPIPRPEVARPDVASSVPPCTNELGVALNVRTEFVFVDEAEPVVVDFFEASVSAAPIGIQVFGEGVPMGAGVTRTALSSSPGTN